ncbi:hypothetical protein ACWGQ5_51365 [Streptomyces sp. NPDC055722]
MTLQVGLPLRVSITPNATGPAHDLLAALDRPPLLPGHSAPRSPVALVLEPGDDVAHTCTCRISHPRWLQA